MFGSVLKTAPNTSFHNIHIIFTLELTMILFWYVIVFTYKLHKYIHKSAGSSSDPQ